MATCVGLIGATVVNKEGGTTATDIFCKKGYVVGLYFSAHWCPPCRGFTPVLAEFYNNMKTKGVKFEIVFVSSDRDEEDWANYYKEMPWLAIPYSDRDKKDELSKKFDVKGIPTFVLLDGETGKPLNKNARGNVTSDPDGTNFPWESS